MTLKDIIARIEAIEREKPICDGCDVDVDDPEYEALLRDLRLDIERELMKRGEL